MDRRSPPPSGPLDLVDEVTSGSDRNDRGRFLKRQRLPSVAGRRSPGRLGLVTDLARVGQHRYASSAAGGWGRLHSLTTLDAVPIGIKRWSCTLPKTVWRSTALRCSHHPSSPRVTEARLWGVRSWDNKVRGGLVRVAEASPDRSQSASAADRDADAGRSRGAQI
jgi:hypothetical protein